MALSPVNSDSCPNKARSKGGARLWIGRSLGELRGVTALRTEPTGPYARGDVPRADGLLPPLLTLTAELLPLLPMVDLTASVPAPLCEASEGTQSGGAGGTTASFGCQWATDFVPAWAYP